MWVVGLLYIRSDKRASTRRVSAVVDPFAQQRGLAKAGRGGDEGELAVKSRVQPLESGAGAAPARAVLGAYTVWFSAVRSRLATSSRLWLNTIRSLGRILLFLTSSVKPRMSVPFFTSVLMYCIRLSSVSVP